MDVLTAINKQFQEDRKKQLKIRFKVKNRDIVKHLSIDELKRLRPLNGLEENVASDSELPGYVNFVCASQDIARL